MYLTKRQYVGGSYEHRRDKGTVKIAVFAGTENQELIEIPANEISHITLDAGYWRKANQIHNWFVQNVQNGVDEGQESYVRCEQLGQLKSVCEAILRAKKAHGSDSPQVLNLITETLPPKAGFFFGSTDIDEYYFADLERTVEILKDIDKSKDYFYEASW